MVGCIQQTHPAGAAGSLNHLDVKTPHARDAIRCPGTTFHDLRHPSTITRDKTNGKAGRPSKSPHLDANENWAA